MYEERPSRLARAVVWSRTPTPSVQQARVLPDGCMDLIWSDGLLVAGPDTHAHVVVEGPGTAYTGVRFGPGTGPLVLGVPAHELRDQRVPLSALRPDREVRELTEQVAAASDRGRALEAVAARASAAHRTPVPLPPLVVDALERGEPVAGVARAVGLSERQLHRRCLDAFGYGPKTLLRVLRMQRALESARAGTPLATVAAQTGYADQAHLARDVKDLAGLPITALLIR
ncbi:helix-turn-helix transcriptional regulator [Wenjunlia tyrosinilytica]|uniref:AraC family transcriptional regulator n=1 Tax=Wenjunlia tyrosinilytica TaxID=1544741 RepID=A0A918DWI1_9ACTN|nr:helix-turn-helix transcriptional regulator [Wenjunlia tyrosinilytica]GGO84960.1 AraC family transcriptional regulator [Wenjunlia tyrosinilytica]